MTRRHTMTMTGHDGRHEFNVRAHSFGTVTVGERGRIVIPAEARKKCHIGTGDRLTIMGTPDEKGLMLLQIAALRGFMAGMLQELPRVEPAPQGHTRDRMEEKAS